MRWVLEVYKSVENMQEQANNIYDLTGVVSIITAQIPLTLSCYLFLYSLTIGKFSRLHPVSTQS